MFQIKDRPGAMPVADMRRLFEGMVKDTPVLATNTPLGTMEINGQFSHYVNADTDTMWIGFALGMRCHERVSLHQAMAARSSTNAEPLCWVPEDELPKSLTSNAYDALFPYSRVDFIRQFPIYGPSAAPVAQEPVVTDEMVTRFLGWHLPQDFAPGAGISFTPSRDPLCWPVGTDLFNDPQARAMLEYVLQGAPVAAQSHVPAEFCDQEALEGVTAWLEAQELTVNVGNTGDHGLDGDTLIESSAGWLLRLVRALQAAPVVAQAQPVVNRQLTTEPSAQDREDAEVTAYALPGGVSVERCMQLNGTYLWAVRDSFKNCLSKSSEWEYEPFPSSRTENWLAQHRFDSADAAIDAARAAKEQS